MEQQTDKQLINALQKRIEKVCYFCTAENVSPNLRVHEIRKAFKRIRAFLRLYSNSKNTCFKQCKKTVVRHGKSLSLLRESYVNIQVYEKIISENHLISERKTKAIKEKLIEQNRLLIKRDLTDTESTKAIYESMNWLKEQIGIFKDEYPKKEELLNCLYKSYKKAHSFYNKVSSELNPEQLHDLRKRIKVLYYQMDFLKYINPKYFKQKSAQLHNLTEQLGHDHDMYIFLNDLKLANYDFEPLEQQILSRQVEHSRELNAQKLDIRLKQLFDDSPADFRKKMEEVFERY